MRPLLLSVCSDHFNTFKLPTLAVGVSNGATCFDGSENSHRHRHLSQANPIEKYERQGAGTNDDPQDEALKKWAKTNPLERFLV
jgi:hypothetical protein